MLVRSQAWLDGTSQPRIRCLNKQSTSFNKASPHQRTVSVLLSVHNTTVRGSGHLNSASAEVYEVCFDQSVWLSFINRESVHVCRISSAQALCASVWCESTLMDSVEDSWVPLSDGIFTDSCVPLSDGIFPDSQGKNTTGH